MPSPLQKHQQLDALLQWWATARRNWKQTNPGSGFDYCYWDCDSHETAKRLNGEIEEWLVGRGHDVTLYQTHYEEPNGGTRLVVRLLGAEAPPLRDRTFGILALSGGGMRGLFQAAVLKRIATDLPRTTELKDRFRMIAGTSTGAIIAASLAFGFQMSEVCSLFIEHGRDIFAKRALRSLRKGGRYRNGPLKSLLDERFKKTVLGDAHPNLVICATTLERYQTRAFCSWRDKEMLVADAVLASCAAPTYFPAITPEPFPRSYVDGGIWANNPSLSAVLEAQMAGFAEFNDMWLLAIGNGEVALGKSRREYNGCRTLSTAMINTVLDMMFSTQSSLTRFCVERLIGENELVTLDVQLPKYIGIDDVSASIELLPGLADECAAKNIARVRSKMGLPSGSRATAFAAPRY